MTRTIKAVCVLVGLFCVLNSFVPQLGGKERVVEAVGNDEIRAVWAATVFSLDYPSKQTKNNNELKSDIDRLINNAYDMGFNTIFFQVRPSGDAFYKSNIFPWSRYLTGIEGQAPQNGFDPLEYAVKSAHEKGIKLHAWINPYRVTAVATDNEKLSEKSIAYKYPELMTEHTDGKLYLNPGEPASNQIVIDGAIEIIRGYEVDGIHLDDYFYPGSDFPDGEAFAKYGGEYLDIGDWRRANITALVDGLHRAVKKENKDVVFSVSPCGIWANKKSNPNGSDTAGVQAYYDYYADTRLWVKEEMLDWIVPQIYWNIGYNAADFEELVSWWNDVAEGTNVKICVGQAIYRAADETDAESVWYSQSGVDELKRQTEMLRELKNVGGYAHYRLGSIEKSDWLTDFAIEVNGYKNSVFSDTNEYPWAENAIEELYEKGIVNGMGDGTFGCKNAVSRADFMVMMIRMTEKSAEFEGNFSDVTADKYYYKAIGIAKELGYTEGRGDNIFDPTGEISRQDMAVMAYRILKAEGKIKDGNSEKLGERFLDADEISEYAREAVAAMLEAKYLSGYETGEFKPQGIATRAETAVFMCKILKAD